ncbi:MAG TPA: hypothetical protein VH678_00705 [Xanthobacteraceae bacterium]|jgi:hypothetical protein
MSSSAPKQLDKLFNRESGIRNDTTQRAGSELLVVRNNDPGVRLVASKHHMAAGLAAEDEPGALQGGADLTAG